MAFDIASFEAGLAALVAKEAATLSPAQIAQVEGIAQQTFTLATADISAGRDPIPDVVAGLNQIDAIVNPAAPCFASGTHIQVSQGSKAVEELAVGDVVVTSSGATRPITWLGHRTVNCRRHPRPHEVMPVRIAANAFGARLPERDLVVSPGHSLCVDVMGEVLIPASSLVNGTTICQDEVDEVTYWHVELHSHDILLAENLPAESYLDMGNRGFFGEEDVVALNASPDAPAKTHADFCRPFHAAGVLVDAVRARLGARAEAQGWRPDPAGTAPALGGALVGAIDVDLAGSSEARRASLHLAA